MYCVCILLEYTRNMYRLISFYRFLRTDPTITSASGADK